MKYLVIVSILLSIVLLFGIVPMGNYVIQQEFESQNFITSIHSKYCYRRGTQNKNIKFPLYYPSLDLCGKPLK